jgi:hypothetical protein
MHPVVSSDLRAVGYDPVSQTLRIEFHDALMSITTFQNMFTEILCQLLQKGDFMLISSRMFTNTNDYNLLTTGTGRGDQFFHNHKTPVI